uniref:Uncharacterized protein n=1 Tax=Arundo donax TaxID=35708 RepID=A0A0A9AIC0_ARUDO
MIMNSFSNILSLHKIIIREPSQYSVSNMRGFHVVFYLHSATSASVHLTNL